MSSSEPDTRLPGTPWSEPRSVRIGRSDEDWIEVLAGLDEGERVVIDGHFALRDGSGVTVDAANLDAQ